MRFLRRLSLFLPLAGAGFAAVADPGRIGGPVPLRQAFHIDAPAAAAPVPIGGANVLRYELHITSFARRPLVLDRLRILAAGRELGSLEAERLSRATSLVGAVDGDDPLTLAPGRRAIVYVDLALGAAESVPTRLDHVVLFSDPSAPAAAQGMIGTGAVRVDVRPLPRLGPPLRGGPWAAVYEPSMQWGHRRVPYAVAGAVRIPGRHAVDWMRVGEDGRATGDSGLGAEVLAVADATVVAARDGIPEPAGERPAVSLDEASGNYVALDLGDGRFAFYEHLMPGLRVRPGDRVRRGQVIGRLGSTGQASRPHLHFHVADANATLDAEGLPYRLAAGTVIGRFASIDAFDRGEKWARAADGGSGGDGFFPEPNVVVRFP